MTWSRDLVTWHGTTSSEQFHESYEFSSPLIRPPLDLRLIYNLCLKIDLLSIIRKIFYPDLTTLGCSDPQIKQIVCRFPLSALIQAGSTVDQLDHPRFIWSPYALKPFPITLFTLITLCFNGFITGFLIIYIIRFYTHLYVHKFSTLIIILKKNTHGIYSTWGLAGCMYLFFHQKYEAQNVHIPEACLVASTCFSIENMKPGIYLRPSRL